MRLLIVDNHAEGAAPVADQLKRLGHSVELARDGREALQAAARARPDLIIAWLRMPVMGGIELLQALEGVDDPPPLALLTTSADTEAAIEAKRMGAFDYLRTPIGGDELRALLDRVASLRRDDACKLSGSEEADGLVVRGTALEHLVALADRLHAVRDMPCLIEGETGTGKALFARRLHHGGRPAKAPFISINCAAITPAQFESELFGHASDTGAGDEGAIGKLQAACGGTILLDEIGDLPPPPQATLLRLLEDRTWHPVGSAMPHRLEARVLCATNARLLERVRAGRFREDLYYRLKGGHIRLPPLRERRADIVPLAEILLQRARRERGRGPQRLSSDAGAFLAAQPWPGNVRELMQLLGQAVLLHDGAVLDAERVRNLAMDGSAAEVVVAPQPWPVPSERSPMPLRLPPDRFDLDAWHRSVVAAALALNEGSPVRTATYLGITRKVLYTLRKRYGMLESRDEQ
jgi:two-component system response regulator AtoC